MHNGAVDLEANVGSGGNSDDVRGGAGLHVAANVGGVDILSWAVVERSLEGADVLELVMNLTVCNEFVETVWKEKQKLVKNIYDKKVEGSRQ